MIRSRRIFLDTSVIFAAVLSESGGARVLFKIGEAGILQLVIGKIVLRECEQVVMRKAPASLPTLARLLHSGKVEIMDISPEDFMDQAKAIVSYEPDAAILAEALAAAADWFITHDKAHFLKADIASSCPIPIGTPGDLIQVLEDEFTQLQ